MNTKNKKIWIFLFTIPCMILFALVYAVPIITVFYTSLCDYTAFSSPAFQGIKNFITISVTAILSAPSETLFCG